MPHPSPEHVEKTLVTCVRAALAQGQDVEIPGLGRFTVVHHSAGLRTNASGATELVPPRDEIVFVPTDTSS